MNKLKCSKKETTKNQTMRNTETFRVNGPKQDLKCSFNKKYLNKLLNASETSDSFKLQKLHKVFN